MSSRAETTGRREFLRRAGIGAAWAVMGGAGAWPLEAWAKAPPGAGAEEEAALRGRDPDRIGGYRLGKEIYRNALRTQEDLQGCRLEGEAVASFPRGRLRLENKLDPRLGQKSNFVYWLPPVLPESFAASWEFWPVREPGLCMVFFAARGRKGEDIFDPALARRTGEYPQYHHGEIDALHLSYFRRSKPGERMLNVCNLRKSYGFHLVAEGADPIPNVADARPPYAIDLVKCGPEVAFFVNRLQVLTWTDDGKKYGPVLGPGRMALRQMAPLQAEYENLVVREVIPA